MSSTVSFLTRHSSLHSARPRDDCPGAVATNRTAASVVERLEALREATGVALLGAGERLEPLGDLLEAFVAGGLREPRVHLGVLVGLTGDGRVEVVGGGP